ncbi:Ulp1 family isopeptidase [Wolbachia endosymbiont (group B) of Limnophora tigrina]|uniref:Ulp1 family isopeptidase n=1 Tax=Wolbachia endosymbiont (group B) of Limnophora tigrina TaxID=3139317 RepID=UPI0035B561D9
MLISNPVVWVLMGIILTVAYKMVVEPLFYLAKGYINGKRASKEEKSKEAEIRPQELQKQPEENQERPKTPDRDSGVITLEKAIDNNSFLHKTEKEENYNYKLTTTDIRDIAEACYKWTAYKNRKGLKDTSKGVYFACSDNSSLEVGLQEYKNVEREDSNLVFTSIVNLNGNHWVTLVIARDSNNNQFRAYYCDSFGNTLPSETSSVLQKTLEIDSSNVEISKTKQQTDTHNCGIFALENAKKITDMLKVGKSFDEINAELLKYKPSKKELKKKRKELAEALKNDKQSRGNAPIGGPGNISRKDSGVSLDSVESKQTKIVTYNTAGAGNNCFFHSVFGQNNSGTYRAEKAQEMRLEWHKFLSQFEHLDDYKMSNALIKQMQTVFTMFLDRPQDLTGKSDEIKRLVEQTNNKIKEADSKTEKLKEEIVKNFRDDGDFRKVIYPVIERAINQRNKRNIAFPRDQKTLLSVEDLLKEENRERLYNDIAEDLESCALILNPTLSKREYGNTYDPNVIKDSFINDESVYKAYREAIRGSYCVFIEEIPILASLADIEITVHHQNNGNNVHTVFEPNPEIIEVSNLNTSSVEVYQRNSELWGDKRQETIYLKPGHYERAEIVEVEPSLMEKVSSAVQNTAATCVNALGLNT